MFKRVKTVKRGELEGSSLWFTLPHVTNQQVKKLFGTGLADQDKVKYSTSIFIRSEVTGRVHELYKASGEWRVGSAATYGAAAEHDRAELEKLFTV